MRIKPPAKTFTAAAFYFSDSLTDVHRTKDVHQWNAMAGLFHLAHALESLESDVAKVDARLAKIEELLQRRG